MDGKTFEKFKICGWLVILTKTTYNDALNTKNPMITTKLNEKITINNEARIETIIRANNDMGRPNIIARFLMFL